MLIYIQRRQDLFIEEKEVRPKSIFFNITKRKNKTSLKAAYQKKRPLQIPISVCMGFSQWNI